jgi:hypothetical protein
MRSGWHTCSVCFPLLLLCACTGTVRLIPAEGWGGDLPYAAHAQTAGVNILVETEAWTGNPAILDKVRPLRVTIRNNSGRLLRIRHSEFTLTGKKIYPALPPYGIHGSVETRLGDLLLSDEPQLKYEKFSIAPHCSRRWPGVPVWPDSFAVDRSVTAQQYRSWVRIELPTAEMLRYALPDGVVGDNGFVTGFLYFEKLSGSEHAVDFTAVLVSAEDGRRFGEITVPFTAVTD